MFKAFGLLKSGRVYKIRSICFSVKYFLPTPFCNDDLKLNHTTSHDVMTCPCYSYLNLWAIVTMIIHSLVCSDTSLMNGCFDITLRYFLFCRRKPVDFITHCHFFCFAVCTSLPSCVSFLYHKFLHICHTFHMNVLIDIYISTQKMKWLLTTTNSKSRDTNLPT